MLVSSFALAVLVLGFSPSTDPEELVAQLGSRRYAERESAEVELARIGRAALPALRAAKTSNDPEIRMRAASLTARLEASLLVQPTSISLDFQDVTIAGALRSINEQSGLSLVLEPTNRPDDFARRFSIPKEELLPFWKAIDALCDAGRLHYIPGAQVPLGSRDGMFSLHSGPARSREPVSDSGPFRVHLTSVQFQPEAQFSARQRVNPFGQGRLAPTRQEIDSQNPPPLKQFFLQVCVAAEPRLSIVQNGPLKLSTAVDDRGQSLLIRAGSGTFQHFAGYSGMNPMPLVRLKVDLAYPKDAGKRIRLIQGTVPVVVSTRKLDPLEITIAGSLGKTFRNEDVTLTLRDSRGPKNNQPAVIELSMSGNGPIARPMGFGDGEPLGFLPDASQQQIEILDAEGRTIPWFPAGIFYNGEETRMTLTMVNVNRGTPATPSKIRFHGMVRTSTEIPFEFRDVPMP